MTDKCLTFKKKVIFNLFLGLYINFDYLKIGFVFYHFLTYFCVFVSSCVIENMLIFKKWSILAANDL